MDRSPDFTSANCIALPREETSALYYATPAVCSVGVLGNIIVLLVLSNGVVRTSCPSFAYLIALACMDLVRILCIFVDVLKGSLLFKPEIKQSYAMIQVSKHTEVLEQICHNVALWYMAMAVTSFTASSRCNVIPSWTRISRSRIIALLLFVASCLVNLPRYFRYSITEILDHCIDGARLYKLQLSAVGQSDLYIFLYILINLALSFAVPCLVLLTANFVSCIKLGCSDFCKRHYAMRPTKNDEELMYQRGKLLEVLSVAFLLLETPLFVVNLTMTVLRNDDIFPGWNHVSSVAALMSEIRAVLPFLIYAVWYSEFRKVFARIFCCAQDEYYEPCACLCRPYRDTDERSTLKQRHKKTFNDRSQKTLSVRSDEKLIKSEHSGSSLGSSGWI